MTGKLDKLKLKFLLKISIITDNMIQEYKSYKTKTLVRSGVDPDSVFTI